jgi:hypothetical protein
MRWMIVLGCLMMVLGCKSQKKENNMVGTLTGEVRWVAGNQMPGPGREMSAGMAIVREVWVYEVLTTEEMAGFGPVFEFFAKEPLAVATTNAAGQYSLQLPQGVYSVFTKEPNGLFANRMDGQGRIQAVEVHAGKVTQLDIQIDYEAAY